MADPTDMRIVKVIGILDSVGYVLRGVSGSHYHFKKEGKELITFPVHNGKVERLYLKDLRNIIIHELNHQNNEEN